MALSMLCSLALTLMFLQSGSTQIEKTDGDLTGYRLAALKFGGSTVFAPERLIAEFPIRVGDSFNRSQVREGLERIRRLFEQAGYIDIRYTPWIDVDRKAQTVSCSFDLWAGRQYTVRRIDFVGSSFLPDRDVRSAMADMGLEEGKIFHPGLLDEAVKIFNKLLGAERLGPKDCRFSKPADFPGMVDITIRLQSDVH